MASSITTLARPYAKAAFDLARSQSDLAGWDAALAAAGVAVAEPGMADWLQSPGLDRQRAVALVAEAAGREADSPVGRFLGILADNGRLQLLPEISRLFGELRAAAENRLRVRVVSAIPLDADQATRMSAALARRFDCEIELNNEVDPGVLGGAVIYAGDQVIDGSLRGRLAKLQSSLA